MGIRYGTSTSQSITLNGLAAAAARESTAIDLTTLTPHDLQMTIKFRTGVVTGPDNAIYVYAYGSEDGTNYGGGVTGSDAAVTTTPANLGSAIAICSVGILTNTDFVITVNSLFQHIPFKKVGIVFDNRAGALNNTPANFALTYTPVYFA